MRTIGLLRLLDGDTSLSGDIRVLCRVVPDVVQNGPFQA
jgi:hypothetical protein